MNESFSQSTANQKAQKESHKLCDFCCFMKPIRHIKTSVNEAQCQQLTPFFV